MLVKSISFISDLEDITGIENENIDVSIELKDGSYFCVVVGTARNIEYLMDKEKKNYFGPCEPFIIVKQLTKDIIEETVKAYAEYNNAYWLKFHQFSSRINKIVFDKLQAEDEAEDEYEERLQKLDELYEKYRQKLKELDELDNS